MEQRRFILFLVLSMAVLVGWTKWGVPLFFPKPAVQQADNKDEKKGDSPAPNQQAQAGDAVVARKPGEVNAAASPATEKEKAADGKKIAAVAPKPEQQQDGGVAEKALPKEPKPFENQKIKLGTLEVAEDAKSAYFLLATVDSSGAALESVELNDPRYRDLENAVLALRLVGSTPPPPASLSTDIEFIDKQLEPFGTQLSKVDWEVFEKVEDPEDPALNSAVTFRYVSPDGKLEVRKRYSVNKIDFNGEDPKDVRDTNPKGYQVDFSLTVKNTGEQPSEITYTLLGPAGLPLEDAENTRKFRDVKMSYLNPEDATLPPDERRIVAKTVTARKIAEDALAKKKDVWQQPFRYIGVDVQYFTALLFPVDDQLKKAYVAEAAPVIIGNPEKDHTNISVALTSKPLSLQAGEEAVHGYTLYAGPKRESLLAPLGAEKALDFGWFGFVSKPMLALLKFLHDVGFPYGVAIIILTMMVRACMYPISRKQAMGAQKMKELQPHIAELKKKYANEKEKLARAQMELFSKHNYNPFAGCLPIFLQLPIFIGLYQALSNAVDLRAAKFLWIDNLASPDRLFRLPFNIPFLGADFNLLPLLTIVLFIVQQKMFMPPAAPDDEQAQMQQKMMTYMMVFMGFLFYHVPAGLCVYFIASSLWGMGERKLLDLQKKKLANMPQSQDPPPATGKGAYKPKDDGKKPPSTGLWARLVASAEAATHQTKTNGKSKGSGNPKKKGKSRR